MTFPVTIILEYLVLDESRRRLVLVKPTLYLIVVSRSKPKLYPWVLVGGGVNGGSAKLEGDVVRCCYI